jgi:2-polyprenyl-3-methyl-5-hydroxy-6-metoxy-1,4-benzoquinol methylase
MTETNQTPAAVAEFDVAKAEAFGEKMVGNLNSASIVLMSSIGHRTGLFDAMAGLSAPATTQQIADAAGLSERYVREWLGAMVAGKIVEYSPDTRTYRLPPEHAAGLTRAASPDNIAVLTQWIAVLGSVESKVVDAFTHGRGVPYEAYERFHEVMAEDSGQTTVGGLDEHIVPHVEGLEARLEAGIDVLDVGCGSGRAQIHLASRFPNSRFVGFDLSPAAIDQAQRSAADRGLTNIRFEARDVTDFDPDSDGAFDLITAYDVIHDLPRPDKVLPQIHRALRPDGIFLMQDIRGSSHVHLNADGPIAPFIYTISCMHCMSVSLADEGMGLGAAWGKELALQFLATAGFTDVSVSELPHDIQNYYYICRPQAQTARIAG